MGFIRAFEDIDYISRCKHSLDSSHYYKATRIDPQERETTRLNMFLILEKAKELRDERLKHEAELKEQMKKNAAIEKDQLLSKLFKEGYY